MSISASDLLYVRLGTQKILGREPRAFGRTERPSSWKRSTGARSASSPHHGRYNLCPTHGQHALGVGIDGGMSERFRAPPERLVPVPVGLDLAATRRSWNRRPCRGTPRVSAGPARGPARCGRRHRATLGLLAVASARRMGANDVALDPRHPHQRAAGERLGASAGCHGVYDVVVRAAEPRRAWRAPSSWSRREARLSCSACTSAQSLDWMPLFHREASIIPSLGYCRHDDALEMEDAAAMLADDPEIARTLITHRFPLEGRGRGVSCRRRQGLRRDSGGDRVVRAEDQFHVGIVVDDLPPALRGAVGRIRIRVV